MAQRANGGPVKTEDDPLDPNPTAASVQSLAAIRHLESAVTGTAGIEGVVLRYGMFYGPGTGLSTGGDIVEMVRKRSFPIVGGGGGVWSFVHMDDVTGATVAAVERGAPGVYNIVDDEPAQVAEWLPYLAETLGAKRPMRLPAWLVRPMLGEHGVSMMTAIRGSSNAKAKRELGWSLSYPSWRQGFRTGLGRTVAGGKKTLVTSLILIVLLVACAPAADPTQTYPAELKAAVEKAAREKDLQALSDHMVDNFRFSFGRDPSRTKALSRYRTHPEILDKMANVLGQACALKTSGTETYYICPAAAADENKAYYDWRAGFRLKEDGTWEYVWFIAGD